MTAPVIETDRLVLRDWHDDDVEPFAALNADPVVMEHFPSTLDAQQSAEMVDRHRAVWGERGFGLWAVEVRDTSTFIGFVGLTAPGWEAHFTPAVEVGWRLARHAWGRGYAPEAARAAVRWGFETLALPDDEIVSFTVVANRNSRRVMEKLGMTHDPADDFDHPILPLDSPYSRHVLYRLSRASWQSAG